MTIGIAMRLRVHIALVTNNLVREKDIEITELVSKVHFNWKEIHF